MTAAEVNYIAISEKIEIAMFRMLNLCMILSNRGTLAGSCPSNEERRENVR